MSHQSKAPRSRQKKSKQSRAQSRSASRSSASFSTGEDSRDDTRFDLSRGLENIGFEDVIWTGEDGELDYEAHLERIGYDPHSPLELLLLAIIRGNECPQSGTDQVRLRTAMNALLGSASRGAGRDEEDDYDVLLEVAWRYHKLRFEGGNQSLPALIRDCLSEYEGFKRGDYRRSAEGENETVRRLSGKFRKYKDELLVRVTNEVNHDRMDVVQAVSEIAKRLGELGVKLDHGAIRARLRRTGRKSG